VDNWGEMVRVTRIKIVVGQLGRAGDAIRGASEGVNYRLLGRLIGSNGNFAGRDRKAKVQRCAQKRRITQGKARCVETERGRRDGRVSSDKRGKFVIAKIA